ncbi:MAG TPA: hypothetical protein VHD36_16260 [Pirellulales bacterium]|nr:hypothetical protein [Pirellulales bacterium]
MYWHQPRPITNLHDYFRTNDHLGQTAASLKPVRQVALILAASLAAALFCSWAQAQPLPPIVDVELDIYQDVEPDGSVGYSIQSHTLEATLQAPDGTQFPAELFALLDPSKFVTVSHLSFADLQARFMGTWTIADASTPTTFTLNPFPLDAIFHEVPVLIYPAPGSVVPNSFNVKWEYPSGAHPSGNFISAGAAHGNISLLPADFYKITDDMHDTVSHAALQQDTITLRGGGLTRLTPFLSSTTVVEPDAIYNIHANFFNASAYETVTVLPEPSTFILAGATLACMGIAGLLRRKRG